MKLKKMPEFTVYSLTDTNLNSLSGDCVSYTKFPATAPESELKVNHFEIDFYRAIAVKSRQKSSLFGVFIPSLIAVISIGFLSATIVQEHLGPSSQGPERVSYRSF